MVNCLLKGYSCEKGIFLCNCSFFIFLSAFPLYLRTEYEECSFLSSYKTEGYESYIKR